MKLQIEQGKQRFSLLLCFGLTLLFVVQPFSYRPLLSSSTAAAQASDVASPLFKSTDGGGSWTPSNAGITAFYISELAIDPVSPNNIYASGDRGVFKSTDGGNNWIAPNGAITLSLVEALAIDPVTPSNLYAGTITRGAYKSTDGGINWDRINNGLGTVKGIRTLVINPVNPSILYLGTDQTIFKSTDGGASWDAALKLPSTGDVIAPQDLALDPLNPSTVYVIAAYRIFKSIDGGGSWKDISGPLNSPSIIAIAPSNPSTVYVRNHFTVGEFFKSTDGEDIWTKITQSTDALTRFGVSQLVIDPSAPSTLYAASQGVFKSTDGGSTWVDTGLSASGIFALAINPRNPSTLYAGTGSGARPVDSPWITTVFLNGKKLIVYGQNFDTGAVILLDGEQQQTKYEGQPGGNRLISRKAGKKAKRNPEVKLQIRNANGKLSQLVTVSQAVD